MKRKFIQANNVTKIAKALLQIDLSNWQEKYHLDAQAFIVKLQQALEQYTNPPTHEQEIKNWNTIDNIEQALKNLISHVNEFIALLTPDAQQQIEQQFNQPP